MLNVLTLQNQENWVFKGKYNSFLYSITLICLINPVSYNFCNTLDCPSGVLIYVLLTCGFVTDLLVQPLTILCHTFHDIDRFTTGFPRGDSKGHANIFRAVKQCLPGPVSLFFAIGLQLNTTVNKQTMHMKRCQWSALMLHYRFLKI